MAAKKTTAKYESKATTISISAVSRASIKIRDNFYTLEYGESRSVPEDANIEKERALLWETVNGECDKQVQDVLEMFRNKK